MRTFKALLAFGLLSAALIGSATLFEAMPHAYAQQCPNGYCR
jgi:hypothetical protein